MTTTYTPADSLTYLVNSSLLDAVMETLADDDGDTLEQRAELAFDMVRTLQKIIAFEATYHGLNGSNRYSDDTPVLVAYEEPYREQDASGMWHIGTREVVTTRHPSGALTHPVIGNGGEVA